MLNILITKQMQKNISGNLFPFHYESGSEKKKTDDFLRVARLQNEAGVKNVFAARIFS